MIGIALALLLAVAGLMWVSDREPSMRTFFAEVLPEAEVLAPHELESRLALGQYPDALIIDGTQLLELPPRLRASVLELPRVLICTGILLASMPMNLVSGPDVAILAKPFCAEDLEAAIDWLRGTPSTIAPPLAATAAIVQRRRPRRPGRRLPTA